MVEEVTIGMAGMVFTELLPLVSIPGKIHSMSEEKVETGLKIDKRLLLPKGRI